MEKRRLPGKTAKYSVLSWMVLTVLLSPAAQAATGLVDGEHGVLHVSGALTESACRLEMSSADQSVELGDVGTGRLNRLAIGERRWQ